MEENTNFMSVALSWLSHKRQYVKRSTYAVYCNHVYSHLIPSFGQRTRITEKEVQDFVDRERYAQRVSQLSITSMAGYKDDGQTYARMYAAKDCRLSKGLPFLLAEGYKLAIVKEEK